jgi:hypothetical protein
LSANAVSSTHVNNQPEWQQRISDALIASQEKEVGECRQSLIAARILIVIGCFFKQLAPARLAERRCKCRCDRRILGLNALLSMAIHH